MNILIHNPSNLFSFVFPLVILTARTTVTRCAVRLATLSIRSITKPVHVAISSSDRRQRFEFILRNFSFVYPSWESNNALISPFFLLQRLITMRHRNFSVLLFLQSLRERKTNNYLFLRAISNWGLLYFFIHFRDLLLLMKSVFQIGSLKLSE